MITMALAGYAFAGGDHEGQHAHDTNAASTQGQATQGSTAASTCTPEHEKMGHCKMDEAEDTGRHAHQDDGHGNHQHMESAVGKPAEAADATKTIEVSLLDSMEFEFAEQPDIQGGDIVKFVVINNGKLAHEFSIGNESEQDAHRKMMQQMPDMQHADGNTVTVQPGESKELAWQFTGPNKVMFACNVPGHFEAGMHHETEVQ
ncbi:MAG: copper-binding protein [Gammaproteobacteria bacterium]|nr:copper-binding protein [Gammaproteobacteria bacterium]MBU1724271.1 copper-binding protein [Gammaproteobacteria bacterium]MBU2006301.1 copper-binding protein [Gammaproteobacteria bacterium]